LEKIDLMEIAFCTLRFILLIHFFQKNTRSGGEKFEDWGIGGFEDMEIWRFGDLAIWRRGTGNRDGVPGK